MISIIPVSLTVKLTKEQVIELLSKYENDEEMVDIITNVLSHNHEALELVKKWIEME